MIEEVNCYLLFTGVTSPRSGTFFICKTDFQFVKNCWLTQIGRTWVEYHFSPKELPALRKAIIVSNGIPVKKEHDIPEENLKILDYCYSRNYEPLRDLIIILKNYRYLGD